MNTDSRNMCQLGRRPVKQGPGPLLSDRNRVEKSATGKSTSTKGTTVATGKLKMVKNTTTVGIWSVQTLWATGKLELLRNEMKKFRFNIVGVLEVR